MNWIESNWMNWIDMIHLKIGRDKRRQRWWSASSSTSESGMRISAWRPALDLVPVGFSIDDDDQQVRNKNLLCRCCCCCCWLDSSYEGVRIVSLAVQRCSELRSVELRWGEVTESADWLWPITDCSPWSVSKRPSPGPCSSHPLIPLVLVRLLRCNLPSS